MMELKVLTDRLRDLLPNAYTDSADPSLCFRACVGRYLKDLEDNAELVPTLQNMEVSQAYVQCCLHLLESLAQIDVRVGNGKPVFSVFQNQQLSKCLEFVVCLGIYPLLSPGVSMPLHLRLENFDKFNCPKLQSTPDRHQRLFEIAKCFDALTCSSVDSLCDLVSPSGYLSDYLALLLQLSYGPVSGDSSSTTTTTVDIIRFSRTRLRSLLARLPRSLAFKELFLFQCGFCKQQSSAKTLVPKWLRDACGRLITQLFIARPRECEAGQSPLKDLIIGVLDVHSTDPRHVSALASALAHILATPPQMTGRNNTTEQYYSSLALQISDALQNSKGREDLLSRVIRLVAIDTTHQIFERDMELGKRLFLEKPLLSKLKKIVQVNQPEVDDCESDARSSTTIDMSDSLELLSAVDLRSVVEFVAKLLDTRHPSKALCLLLARYSRPWFCFCSLLNLVCSVEETGGDCQITEAHETSPVAEFKSQLYSILTSLLKTDNVSSFSLLRSWLHLPPLDSTTLEPLVSSSVSSSLPLPLRRAIVLRPASLVSSVNTDSEAPRSPFRVCQSMETVMEHSTEMIFARVTVAMQLLSSAIHSEGHDSGGLDEGETSEELLLSTWSTSGESNGGSVNLKQSGLAAHLLLSLISDINSRLIEDTDRQPKGRVCLRPEAVVEAMMEEEDEARAVEVPLAACLMASAMLEELNPASLWPSDPAFAVRLLYLTLSRLCLVLDSSADKEVLKMEEESLNLVLAISAFFVHYMDKGEKVPSEVRDRFGELIPLLHRVEEIFPQGNASAELAKQIRMSLLTRGALHVSPSTATPNSGHSSVSKIEPGPKRCLVEELPSVPLSTCQTDTEITTKETAEMSQKLLEIFEQLKDPFIPVRGHALIELSRLLEARDSCIRGFEDNIFKALVEHLDNEDSYVYLNAIRALSAMGNAFTDRLLPLLLSRFSSTSHSLEFRLKVGETIVRVLRELGDIAPKYRDIIVSGLLSSARDPSEFIRAASLSNLAEICRHLGNAIQPVVYEVYEVMESSLKHDSAPMVRKSAAYLARSLFLTSSTLTSAHSGLPVNLPADLIRDVHRLLRDRLAIERDDEVLEQLEAAMAELDARARTTIFRRPDTVHDLVKEIRVLHPFND
ncbi:HEAT and Armadillo domain containing protein [Echinococcus multilocularis]|uniref:HEAT and Armadillo domain containing protein n=1 Tax=Echinococcus multilocularis TaxID=6211 RepID=A0A068YLE4_ECHMU|nr:HEAT and Armadillo domain containing protein [Echinococcus multilocularis]